jgi:aminopeptidase N
LLEAMKPADPARLRRTLIALTRQIGTALRADWLRLYDHFAVPGAYRYHPADAGRRAIRNLALRFLCAAGNADGIARAEAQFAAAGNMTERFGALAALVQSLAPGKVAALARFEADFVDDALVMDKWFALQAGAWNWSDGPSTTLARVRELMQHRAFAINNPNKVYALLGSFFRGNAAEFHDVAGAGYAFWVEQVAALDAMNPQVASRMARALERWQHFTPEVQGRIRTALGDLAKQALSGDVSEIVSKALG